MLSKAGTVKVSLWPYSPHCRGQPMKARSRAVSVRVASLNLSNDAIALGLECLGDGTGPSST